MNTKYGTPQTRQSNSTGYTAPGTVNIYLYMYKMSWLTSYSSKDNQCHATHTQQLYAIHPLFTKISLWQKLFSSTIIIITLPISTHVRTHTHTRLPSLSWVGFTLLPRPQQIFCSRFLSWKRQYMPGSFRPQISATLPQSTAPTQP